MSYDNCDSRYCNMLATVNEIQMNITDMPASNLKYKVFESLLFIVFLCSQDTTETRIYCLWEVCICRQVEVLRSSVLSSTSKALQFLCKHKLSKMLLSIVIKNYSNIYGGIFKCFRQLIQDLHKIYKTENLILWVKYWSA